MVCYSVQDASSLAFATDLLHRISEIRFNYSDPNVPLPCLLVGLKCDKEVRNQIVISQKAGEAPSAGREHLVGVREVTTIAGEAVAEQFGVPFMEVSSKDGYNVLEAFNMLATAIVSPRGFRIEVYRGD